MKNLNLTHAFGEAIAIVLLFLVIGCAQNSPSLPSLSPLEQENSNIADEVARERASFFADEEPLPTGFKEITSKAEIEALRAKFQSQKDQTQNHKPKNEDQDLDWGNPEEANRLWKIMETSNYDDDDFYNILSHLESDPLPAPEVRAKISKWLETQVEGQEEYEIFLELAARYESKGWQAQVLKGCRW
ncbi:MAG: hypothetical protein AAF570_13580, partial [Bacteroidota bacterium]